MIEIAIVEDNDADAELLSRHITQYGMETGTAFRLTRYDRAGALLDNYRSGFHIVFMDIELPDQNGMDAAQRLRELDRGVTLLFITNLNQYAVRGYEVDALDYLLKPVDYYSFSMKLKKAVSAARRNSTNYVAIAAPSGMVKMDIAAIFYVEVITHQLIWHTEEGTLKSRGVMRDLEEQLSPQGFARCGSGYLVNLRHVSALRDFDITVAGDTLRISRSRKKEFVQRLTKYLGGKL